MTKKKIALMGIVAVLVMFAGVYAVLANSPLLLADTLNYLSVSGIYEPPAKSGGGHFQISHDFSFENQIKHADLAVVGEVKDLDIRVFREVLMDVDEEGNEHVFSDEYMPWAEVTISVSEVLNGDLSIREMTFYDYTNIGYGVTDGLTTRSTFPGAIDYRDVDKAIFIFEKWDDGTYRAMGYLSTYKVSEDESGKEIITSDFYKDTDREPLDFNQAKNTAKMIAQKSS